VHFPGRDHGGFPLVSLSPLPLPLFRGLAIMLQLVNRTPVGSKHRRDLTAWPDTLHVPTLGNRRVQAVDLLGEFQYPLLEFSTFTSIPM
jgi:hypothetical protein